MAQEDAIEFIFTGFGSVAVTSPESIDLSRETTAAPELAFNIKRTAELEGSPTLGAICPDKKCEGAIDISASVDRPDTDWTPVRIALSCFRDKGAFMADLESPFVIKSGGKATVSLSDIALLKTMTATHTAISKPQ